MSDLSTVSTADLQAELSRREGVKTYVLDLGDNGSIRVDSEGNVFTTSTRVDFTGPALITVNVD